MKLEKTWLVGAAHTLAAAVGFAVAVGLACAKLPQAPMDDAAKTKAEEAKVKAAEAAKRDGEQLATAQDRVAERYKKEKGIKTAVSVSPAKKK